VSDAARAYLVAGCRPWSRRVFDQRLRALPGTWHYVSTPEELEAALERMAAPPRYAFFPHWSWKVPEAVVERHECVGFHMTDLPYGRGGSPLQHLILRGHRTTKLSALRLVSELDAGPVYAKAELSLHGRAEEIYERAMDVAAEIIAGIVRDEPEPRPQPLGPEGRSSVFRRRRPEESRLPELASPESLYDFIRMLDAPGYPHAFLTHGSFRLAFSHAVLEGDTLTARVAIGPEPAEPRG